MIGILDCLDAWQTVKDVSLICVFFFTHTRIKVIVTVMVIVKVMIRLI